MTRKILSIGLALVFLYNVVGYYPVFEIRRFIIKTDIRKLARQFSPYDRLEKLIFSPEAFQKLRWQEKNKEFRFAGQLYDIVRTEKSPGRIVVYCINDTKELLLIAGYDRHVLNHIKDNPLQGKQKQKLPQKVIKDLFFNTPVFQRIFPKDLPGTIVHDPGISFVPPDIPDPPPRFLS